MDQECVDRVTMIVSGFLPRHYDHEGLALDILFESWRNQVETPSRVFIRNRCYDAMRRQKGEEIMVSRMPQNEPTRDHSVEDRDQVERLVSVLSNTEKKVVWYRFYQELPLAEIAKRMKININDIRETLQVAIYKMKQTQDS